MPSLGVHFFHDNSLVRSAIIIKERKKCEFMEPEPFRFSTKLLLPILQTEI